MDKDRELAGKVDALVGKHGMGRRADVVDDRNVPVLTDVVAAPDWSPADDARVSEQLRELNDEEIDRLSHEIFTRVFDRIDASLAGKLEDRLHTHLAAQITAAVAHVLGDMRQDIANEIGDAVNAVLADLLRKK
jgi:hypothetical protein